MQSARNGGQSICVRIYDVALMGMTVEHILFLTQCNIFGNVSFEKPKSNFFHKKKKVETKIDYYK